MSSEADVLIPTHDHALLLPFAVASVQAQTVEALRIVIVGDGVGDDTREVVTALMRDDERIEFHDLPKRGRTGEVHRGPIVAASSACIVTYACDDDLVAPDLVETMLDLGAEADLLHPLWAHVEADGRVVCSPCSLAEPGWRTEGLVGQSLVGLTGLTHTVAAYRRLPYGWRDTPSDVYTDQYMIRQFLEQDWCRVASTTEVMAAHFPSPLRAHLTAEERHDELAAFHARVSAPGGWEAFRREAHEALRTVASAERLELVETRRRLREIQPEIGLLRAEVAARDEVVGSLRTETGLLQAEVERLATDMEEMAARRFRQRFGRTRIRAEFRQLRALLQRLRASR